MMVRMVFQVDVSKRTSADLLTLLFFFFFSPSFFFYLAFISSLKFSFRMTNMKGSSLWVVETKRCRSIGREDGHDEFVE